MEKKLEKIDNLFEEVYNIIDCGINKLCFEKSEESCTRIGELARFKNVLTELQEDIDQIIRE